MIKVQENLLDELSQKASLSARKRTNFNFHTEASDVLQRMLNVMEPETYVCPHKHENPDKREAFWIVRGRIAVIEFDEHGNITDTIILDRDNGCYGCEILPRVWHSIIALEPGSVAYEVKDGPYDVNEDKHFASWAPKEGEPGTAEYLKQLTLAILND